MDIPEGGFTTMIGPNACGKSTLLRALARMLKPPTGRWCSTARRSRAADQGGRPRLGLLPQIAIAPDGITVVDRSLVGGTRTRDSSGSGGPTTRASSTGDEEPRVTDLAARHIDELSGGQRQRVWLAMALAEETPLLLLDEPTTFLDVAHQIEVLDLCADLHEGRKPRSMVTVLHGLRPRGTLRDAPHRDV